VASGSRSGLLIGGIVAVAVVLLVGGGIWVGNHPGRYPQLQQLLPQQLQLWLQPSPSQVRVPSTPPASKLVTTGPTRTQRIAMHLTDKAEVDFRKQNYTAAIANAKTALDLWPKYRRARVLLDRTERAQQAAMDSIKIH
jgi:hypothetical protein